MLVSINKTAFVVNARTPLAQDADYPVVFNASQEKIGGLRSFVHIAARGLALFMRFQRHLQSLNRQRDCILGRDLDLLRAFWF